MKQSQNEKAWLFVADAHFTGRQSGEMDSFLAFLDQEKGHTARLVILGDLFEFLFGFKRSVRNGPPPLLYEEYVPVFRQLEHLSREGIQITYLEGNHDFRLNSFFQEHLNIRVEVHSREAKVRLGEKRVYLAHGDLSNPGEWRYRILRRILKNPVTYTLMDWVGPSLTRRVAQRLNRPSCRVVHRKAPSTPPPAFRTFAHHKFLEGFDVVILGHAHLPDTVEEWVNGRRCLYFNVGDWRVHRSFLRYTPPDVFQLLTFGEES